MTILTQHWMLVQQSDITIFKCHKSMQKQLGRTIYNELPRNVCIRLCKRTCVIVQYTVMHATIKLLCPKGTQTCALAVYNLIVHSSAAA